METGSGIKEVSLDTIADGVALELFNHEMKNIVKNIMDQNTMATGKRKITLNFEFAPDDMREEIKVLVSVASSLQPIKSYSKTVFTGKKNGEHTLYAADTKQINMFDNGVTGLNEVRNNG